MPAASSPEHIAGPGRLGRGPQRGYSYLAVLFLVALTAAGLAALGQAWSTAAERERERELEFRGGEIARAIASYARATPTPPAQYPRQLRDLLVDSRSPAPRHHLRRLYPDPFTGAPDWELLPQAAQPGGFSAVRSRSDHALLRETARDGTPVRQASDMVFSAQAAASAASAPAAPASAPLPFFAASR